MADRSVQLRGLAKSWRMAADNLPTSVTARGPGGVRKAELEARRLAATRDALRFCADELDEELDHG